MLLVCFSKQTVMEKIVIFMIIQGDRFLRYSASALFSLCADTLCGHISPETC